MTLSFWVPYRTYMIQTDLSKLGTNEFFVGATDMKTGMKMNRRVRIVEIGRDRDREEEPNRNTGATFNSANPFAGENWDVSIKNDLNY
jgi:hypothetical protein